MIVNGIDPTTVLNADTMFTGVFASADERRYMHVYARANHQDPATPGSLKATTVQEVLDLFLAIEANCSAGSLVSVMAGCYYDTDPANIPSETADIEYTSYVLVTDRSPSNPSGQTMQIRVPKMLDKNIFDQTFSAPPNLRLLDILTDSNTGITSLVSVNSKPERKARASS